MATLQLKVMSIARRRNWESPHIWIKQGCLSIPAYLCEYHHAMARRDLCVFGLRLVVACRVFGRQTGGQGKVENTWKRQGKCGSDWRGNTKPTIVTKQNIWMGFVVA